MAAKSVLIIATAFAPENAIGAVRVSKIAKYLVRRGYSLVVISPVLDKSTPLDPSLESAELNGLSRYRVPQSHAFERMLGSRRRKMLATASASSLVSGRGKTGMRATVRTAALRYVHFAYTLVRNYDWARQVRRFISASMAESRFDVVISSYPSLGAMWAARGVRNSGRAGRWVADFRDRVNYSVNSTRLIYRLNTLIQNSIMRRADVIVGVSNGLFAGMPRSFAEKYLTIHNGFDPDDAPDEFWRDGKDGGGQRVRLCYTGSLYGGERDISVVFRALRFLIDSGELAKSDITFAYAGNDIQALRRQAAPVDLDGVLVDHGYVNRAQAMEIQREANAIVVATWNTAQDQGIISGKVYECFMLRKTVLAVVNGTEPDSELRTMLRDVNAGFAFEEAATDAASEFASLCAFLRNLASGQAGRGTYSDEVQQYSYEQLVSKLARAFG